MRRFWGLVGEGVCGVFQPWIHRRWVLGLGARKGMRQQSWFGGSVAVLTTLVAAEGGSELQGNWPNRQTTANGVSNDVDMSRSWVGTTWTITEKIIYRRLGCLWVPPGRDRGRVGCSCEEVPANKIRADWAQGLKRGDGRAILNRCDDRRGRVGWAAMRTGVGM